MIQFFRCLIVVAVLGAVSMSPLLPCAQAGPDEDFATGITRFNAKDYLGAYAKWREAADQGHAGAANGIGYLLRNGLAVKEDLPAALKWFRKAADGGDANGMFNVGIMYEQGSGVPKHAAEALKWFRKADAAGHKSAKSAIQRVTAKPEPKPKPTTRASDTLQPLIGEIRLVGFNFAPRGWAFCDGQLLPISENTALFSILGTIYGGDGRSTFALPDLRGRAPMQPGAMGGGKTLRPGQKLGGAQAAAGTGADAATSHHLSLRYVIALQGVYPSRSKRAVDDRYIGEIVMFAGNFSPYGWLPCDGQELVVDAHEAAFDVLGKTYGGSATTFRVPDLRGRVTVHAGAGHGLKAVQLGDFDRPRNIAVAKAGTGKAVQTPAYLGIRHMIVIDGVAPTQEIARSHLGDIRMFAGKVAPQGWAACNGQLFPIAKHQALFSLYGTTYAGDGRTSFGLPDLRGRRAVHAGRGPGLAPINTGQRWSVSAADATKSQPSIRTRQQVAIRYFAITTGKFPSRN